MDREVCSLLASGCQTMSVSFEIMAAMGKALKVGDERAASTESEAKALAKERHWHIAAAVASGIQFSIRIAALALWRTRLGQSALFKEDMDKKETILVSFSYPYSLM